MADLHGPTMMACVMRLMTYVASVSLIAPSTLGPPDAADVEVLASSTTCPSSYQYPVPHSVPGRGCDSRRAVVAAWCASTTDTVRPPCRAASGCAAPAAAGAAEGAD